jgi:hypothetical protein
MVDTIRAKSHGIGDVTWMWPWWRPTLGVLALLTSVSAVDGRAPRPVVPAKPGARAEPGVPAPPPVVREIDQTLRRAIQRFEQKDVEGVLDHISDRYRTGSLTKSALRQQLNAMASMHEALSARIRIDAVRMIGDRAWIYSTGEITGRLWILGTPTQLLSWRREPEVAWREAGRWRLIGDQQD